jgi:hypothetical protein
MNKSISPDEWISQAFRLIKAIAEWERTNGTASALVTDQERRDIAAIASQWALTHNARGLVETVPNTVASTPYPGKGHPWSDFLHHRARAIEWLYSGEGGGICKRNDAEIARILSMDTVQVMLIRKHTGSQK